MPIPVRYIRMFAKLAAAVALATTAIAPASATLPDQATWAMLLAGFGMVGLAGRHKRTSAA